MGLKILVVEDQFIQATNLSNMLEKAGYTVTGVAPSVAEAIQLLKERKPDMVLLDIFLKGEQTGIDLAKTLNAAHIPFLYLSANSNQSTLELAKETEPYGFLVKPYREKDILAALNIAIYRHKQSMELQAKQVFWLEKELAAITESAQGFENSIEQLLKAFRSFIPFDNLMLDIDSNNKSLLAVHHYKRTGFREFIKLNGWDFVENSQLPFSYLNDLRVTFNKYTDIFYINADKFDSVYQADTSVQAFREFHHVASMLGLPVHYGRNKRANLFFFSEEPNAYHHSHEELLSAVSCVISTVIQHIRKQKQVTAGRLNGVRNKVPEINVKEQLQHVVGNSSKLLYILDQVSQVAAFDTTVLIEGETGVGKEGIAQAIHQFSLRNKKPLVKINCAAMPQSLVETELFGHERGSFTGAHERRIGKFEQAQGGTIFLDEIGEMPIEVQGKLLRVIQEKELERIGGKTTIKIDVRIIAATNRNLYKEIGEGKFRLDLYYRLNVYPINVPPLRERKEDIPLLVEHFLQQHSAQYGVPVKKITNEALHQLISYSWPGNIRELQHVIERHILLARTGSISRINLPEIADMAEADEGDISLSLVPNDRERIIAALKKCSGKVSGKGGAAELLKMPAATLNSRMKKLGITWNYLFD